MPKPEKTYETIKSIQKDIENGAFGSKGFIPPRTELQKMYSVGADTINRAMLFLRASGYVITKPGGKQLIPNTNRLLVPGLTPSFDGFLVSHGKKPKFQDISIDVLDIDEKEARQFHLEPGTKMIRRVRLQGEELKGEAYWYRLASTYYLYDWGIEFLHQMQADTRFNVTRAIEGKTGKKTTDAHSEIVSRFPGDQEQELMEITYDTPVVEHVRMCYTQDRQLIMCSLIVSKSSNFSFVFDYPVNI